MRLDTGIKSDGFANSCEYLESCRGSPLGSSWDTPLTQGDLYLTGLYEFVGPSSLADPEVEFCMFVSISQASIVNPLAFFLNYGPAVLIS